MTLSSLVRSLAATAVLSLTLGGAAQAQNYSFSCVSNNSLANCSTGQAQLGMTLTQELGYVTFLFTNTGALASSITDIYFDWLNPASTYEQGTITSSAGVSYDWGATPPNLPAGTNLDPDFTANLAADSNSGSPGTMANGVNPGEWVSFRFATEGVSTADDLLSGALRIGLHVQGFSNGGSESFVSGGTTPVASPAPEPEAYAMMVLGLGVVGAVARRRRA